MALELEDGSGKSNAQSYASAVTLKAYAKERGADLPSSEGDLEKLLLRAMDFMQGLNYIGERWRRDQALDWPRTGVVIDGFPYNAEELPRELEQLQCVLAIEAHQRDLMPTIEANTAGPRIQQTVGSITTIWANSSTPNRLPAVAKAQAFIAKLVRNSGLTIAVTRG